MDDLTAPAEPQQDELWLISYADRLSLLVGFFIMIIAAVPLRQAAFERIAASISGSKSAPLQQLRERVEDLVARNPELRERVIARDDAEGLGIEFKDALLFDSGSAEIRPEGRRAIAEVAQLVQTMPERPGGDGGTGIRRAWRSEGTRGEGRHRDRGARRKAALGLQGKGARPGHAADPGVGRPCAGRRPGRAVSSAESAASGSAPDRPAAAA